MRKGSLCLAVGVAVLLILPSRARAQDHGSGGGGGGGCGDVFGDLIHVVRHPETGQPILQKRWVELPKAVPGYGWGYCTIAISAAGEELGFAPLSCDVAEEVLAEVVPVDYFGRLNGGRTKERNNRMHFNEVLSSIKAAGFVRPGPAGRLELGYGCGDNIGDETPCAEWATVDSPMESMGLYTRLMKYGHLQTDPLEDDEWFNGDPASPPQYHPALGPDDYPKFHSSLRHLLPAGAAELGFDPWFCFSDVSEPGVYDPWEPFTDVDGDGYTEGVDPFTDINANGVRDEGGDSFLSCEAPESLDAADFARGASFLGGAANKTGRVTVDLVQYFNRILKIAKATSHTLEPADTLPALVRVCPVVEEPDPGLGDEEQVEPVYLMDQCDIVEADLTWPGSGHFPDLQERFVDFSAADYARSDWRDASLAVIRPLNDGVWKVDPDVPLLGWLDSANPGGASGTRIDAFVRAASDALRSIEFIHNYAIPLDLGWDFTVDKAQKTKDK